MTQEEREERAFLKGMDKRKRAFTNYQLLKIWHLLNVGGYNAKSHRIWWCTENKGKFLELYKQKLVDDAVRRLADG